MKHVILCMLLCCVAAYSNACNVCGASAGNQYLGILPQYHKHFIGVQHQYRVFESEHPAMDESSKSTFSKERYNTLQVWGRYHVGERIQLFAFVPYVINQQKEEGGTTKFSGIGDISLLVNVRLIKTKDAGSKWQHNLQTGGGVKLPTGHYDKESIEQATALPNMQPGTASWDFTANANYTVRLKAAGVNIDASYTATTANSFNYKFGNRLSTGVLAFYWFEKGSFTVLPQAGMRLDVASADFENYPLRWKNDMTGGEQLYVAAGAQAYYRQYGLQVLLYYPLSQKFADGLVNTKFKSETGFFFLF